MRHLFCLLLLAGTCGQLCAQEFIWIEGEKPAAASFEWNTAGVEKSELLSEERWLIGKERVSLPDEGALVEYDVDVKKAGTYALWLRVGFEWVRANVAWKFDDGTWTSIGIAAALAMIVTLLEFSRKLGISRFVIRDKEGDQPDFLAVAHLVQGLAAVLSSLLMVSARR